MLGFTGAQLENFKASVDPYARSQGISITWTSSDDFDHQIVARAQANNLPEIALFPQPGILKGLGAMGKLVPLDGILDVPALKESMVTGVLEAGQGSDGKLYGLMVSMNVKSLIFYPKKTFEAAGYAPPGSIPELISLTDKIRSQGRTPWCMGIEDGTMTGWPATDWMEELVLKYGGIQPYDDWVLHRIAFDSPLVHRAAQTFATLMFTDGNVHGGRRSIAGNNYGTAGNPMFWSVPGCYLYKQGNFVAADGFFPNFVLTDIDDRVGVMAFPPSVAGGDNPVEGGGDLAGLLSAENEAARTIMKYMSTKDFGIAGARTGSYLSPHRDFNLDSYPSETIRRIAMVGYTATSFAFDGSDAMPGVVGSGSFWKQMTAWISGTQDLQSALVGIDASWPSG
jgi:alpha-glucoside transport system substrate-binding protein